MKSVIQWNNLPRKAFLPEWYMQQNKKILYGREFSPFAAMLPTSISDIIEGNTFGANRVILLEYHFTLHSFQEDKQLQFVKDLLMVFLERQ